MANDGNFLFRNFIIAHQYFKRRMRHDDNRLSYSRNFTHIPTVCFIRSWQYGVKNKHQWFNNLVQEAFEIIFIGTEQTKLVLYQYQFDVTVAIDFCRKLLVR